MPTSVYRLKSGLRVPSVTTIISRWKESDALIGWSYNTGYEDGEAGRPPNRHARRETSANIGSYAHALFEWHLLGEPPCRPDPKEFIPVNYLTMENVARGENAYQQALDWKDQSGLFVVSLEKALVSEQHEFGGTPDGATERRNKIGLGDWKTSNRLYYDYLLQLAAYWIAWEENHPDQPIEDGVHIVRFAKDWADFTHAHFAELDLEKEQFLGLRKCYARDLVIKRRM